MSLKLRLRRELVVLPLKDSLVRDAPPTQIMYPPGVSAKLVQSVAAVCDGSRSEQAIVETYRSELHAHVTAVLAMLRAADLLEDVRDELGNDFEPSEMAAYLRFYLRQISAEISVAEVLRRIAETQIVLFRAMEPALAEAQELLCLCLSQTGLGTVHVAAHIGDALTKAADRQRTRRSVLVELELEHKEKPVRAARESAWAAGAAYYSILLRSGRNITDAGPLLLPGHRSVFNWGISGGDLSVDPQIAPIRALHWRGAASVVALDLLLSVASVTEGFSLGHLRRIDEGTGSATLVPPPKQTWPAAMCSIPETVTIVEQQFRREHRFPASSTKPDQHPRQRVVMPSGPKTLAQSVTFPLSEANNSIKWMPSKPLNVALLARILRSGMGHDLNRKRSIRRANATAGNLGSAEIFVLAREVSGLAEGVYLYEPRRDCLSRFEAREDRPRLDTTMAATGLEDIWRSCSATLVFTSAVWRLYPKYKNFSARLVRLDAGCAMSQIAALAAANGCSPVYRSAEQNVMLERNLNLRLGEEQVSGVIALHAEINDAPPKESELQRVEGDIGSELFLEDEVLRRLYYATQVNAGPGGGYRARLWNNAEALRADPGFRSLEDTIRSRRSQRRFAGRTVAFTMLSGLAVAAWEMCGLGTGDPLRLFLLTNDVFTLAQSLSVYDPSRKRFEPMEQGTQRLGDGWYVQPEFASAPAAFWITGDIERACIHGDERGYTELLTQAGALGNLLWLLAVDSGLCGCAVAGVVHGRSARGLHLRTGAEAALLAVPLGYPR